MKMTGWQTRLAFPVVPRDQWEFPTMPPESRQLVQEDPAGNINGNNASRASDKGKGREEAAVKSEEPPVIKLPSSPPAQSKRKPRAKPRPKSRAQRSSGQSSPSATATAAATEAPPSLAATALQAPNSNQTEDDELVYIKSEDTDMVMPSTSKYSMYHV